MPRSCQPGNNNSFALPSDQFTLNAVEGLLAENDSMDPVHITVRDLESGSTLDLTIIGVLDTLASGGPIPVGFYVSPEIFGRDVNATQFFFNVGDGVDDADVAIEAAFFQNGVETLNVKESIAEVQAAQKALFNLLIGFMSLGLLVGIAALGVISARTVVERRHARQQQSPPPKPSDTSSLSGLRLPERSGYRPSPVCCEDGESGVSQLALAAFVKLPFFITTSRIA